MLGALGKAKATKIPVVTTAPNTKTATATETTRTTIANVSRLRAAQTTNVTVEAPIVVSIVFLQMPQEKAVGLSLVAVINCFVTIRQVMTNACRP